MIYETLTVAGKRELQVRTSFVSSRNPITDFVLEIPLLTFVVTSALQCSLTMPIDRNARSLYT